MHLDLDNPKDLDTWSGIRVKFSQPKYKMALLKTLPNPLAEA